MSGDHAPLELLRGAILAREAYDAEMIIVGNEAMIRRAAVTEGIDLSGLTLVHAPGVINMNDEPLSVVREKKDSSMSLGLEMLARGEGDAFVSAGNTGALVAGATLIVRKIKGVQRAGIATLLPFPTPCLLMDSGANLEVSASHLEQFAFMGAKYMEKVCGVKSPRVGILNIGGEAGKGTESLQEAYSFLKDAEINFVGNMEGRDIPEGVCDVLVTDGFTGNILLKYTEGIGKFMLQVLKDLFTTNKVTRLAYRSVLGKIEQVKRKFDPSEYGGAPILGIAQPVFKAHGSSDALAIKNAIRQAIAFAGCGLNRDIAMYALGYEERAKERGKVRAEMKKQMERAEKQARKHKFSQNPGEGETDRQE